MLKLFLLVALMGGLSATAERDGNRIVITTTVEGEGHLDHVKIVTARGEENIVQLPDGKWTYESAYDAGIIKGSICTDDYCEPVEAAFAVKSSFSGFLYIMGIAVIAGFLMNFMPCCLPVLGLKLVAAAQQKGGTVAYITGVLVSFLLIATFAVILGRGFSYMGFYWFRVLVVIVCLAIGCKMVGIKTWLLP